MSQTADQNKNIKNRALDLLGNKSPETARDLLVQVCENTPDDAEAWFILAGIQASLGNMHEVINCCQNVIRLNPENATTHYNLGLAQHNLGEIGKAIQSYQNALSINPIYLQAHVSMGKALHASGHYQDAKNSYSKALKLAPDTSQIHYELGLVFHDLKEYEKAESCYRTAIQIQPEHVDALYRLGSILLTTKQLPGAIDCLRKALLQKPDNTDALFQIANAYYATGDLEAAANNFQHALRIQPLHFAAANNLGKLYEQNGHLEEAEKLYRYAIKLNPDNAMFHCNLGRALVSQRKFDKTEAEFKTTLSLDPAYTEAFFGLGQVSSELGKTADAIDYFRKALDLDPDLKDAKYFLQALELPDTISKHHIEHVTDMFDDFSERFEDTLVNKLGYDIPSLIREVVKETLDDSSSHYNIFDAGCGTGLCGPLFRDMADTLVGVDLSPKMIEQAKAKHIYDDLIVGEIAETLNHQKRQYDLIIAADVFVYIGDLGTTFKACQQALAEGGYFIFSTESEIQQTFVLRGSGRYAHSDLYINELAGQYGLKLLSQQACVVRHEYGKPISGSLHILNKTAV